MKRMAFGAGDYTLDMNVRWTLAEERTRTCIRAEMAVASRAAGLRLRSTPCRLHINNDLEGLAS